MSVGNGSVAMALEGGYELMSLCASAEACMKALLGLEVHTHNKSCPGWCCYALAFHPLIRVCSVYYMSGTSLSLSLSVILHEWNLSLSLLYYMSGTSLSFSVILHEWNLSLSLLYYMSGTSLSLCVYYMSGTSLGMYHTCVRVHTSCTLHRRCSM